MATTFSKLCSELSSRTTPALLAAGFVTEAPPFGRTETRYEFKRKRKGGWHIIAILFDKYRHPHFSVQLHCEPGAGLDHLISYGGTLRIGSVSPSYRPWPLSPATFRAERPLWQRLLGRNESTEAHAVSAFLGLLPEIEAWWGDQKSSKHILTSRLLYPGTKRHALE